MPPKPSNRVSCFSDFYDRYMHKKNQTLARRCALWVACSSLRTFSMLIANRRTVIKSRSFITQKLLWPRHFYIRIFRFQLIFRIIYRKIIRSLLYKSYIIHVYYTCMWKNFLYDIYFVISISTLVLTRRQCRIFLSCRIYEIIYNENLI